MSDPESTPGRGGDRFPDGPPENSGRRGRQFLVAALLGIAAVVVLVFVVLFFLAF